MDNHPAPSHGKTSRIAPCRQPMAFGVAALIATVLTILTLRHFHSAPSEPSLARILLISTGWIPVLGAAIWLVWSPARPLGILLFLCFALSDWFETAHWPAFSARIYYFDLLLAAAALGSILRAAAATQNASHAGETKPLLSPTPLNLPLLLLALAGLLFLYRGMETAVRINDAIGDYRRGYFYPLVFFIALFETSRNANAWKWVVGGALAGATGQILSGFLGLFLRNFHQLHFADVFHILSHYSTTMLSLAFYAGLATLIHRPEQRMKNPAFIAIGSVVLLILIANFRSAWLGLAAGAAICLLRSGFRLAYLQRFALPLAVGIAIAALAFILLGNMEIAPGATIKGEVTAKFSKLVNFERDPNTLWRFASYKAAIKAWSEAPLLGTGLGNFLTFYAPGTFSGQYLAFGHRVHNSYLWYLYSAGIFGFAIFAWIQMALLRTLWKMAGHSANPWLRAWALAFLGFTAHFLVTTSFHHLFESAVTSLSLYTIAGFTLAAGARQKTQTSPKTAE